MAIVLRIGIVALVTSAICAACGGTTREPAVAPSPKGATETCPTKGPPSNLAELTACVRGLEFDSSELAGDEQRLMINPPCPGTCRYGPLAKIEPVKGAHEYSDEDLREGRIIARMFVRDGERGYPKLALVPGHMTYWWVQKDATGRSGRSLFISDAVVGGTLVSERRALEVEPVPPGVIRQALAKWRWLADDETAKGTCGPSKC
jgi:hypothetical protein